MGSKRYLRDDLRREWHIQAPSEAPNAGAMASFTSSPRFKWQIDPGSEHRLHFGGDLQEPMLCHRTGTVSRIPWYALIGSLAARRDGHGSPPGCL